MLHSIARYIDLFDRFGPSAARHDPWRRSATPTDAVVAIRRADATDARLLVRLAALDSAAPLGADALLALVDGEPWAAIDLADGRVVADPFRPTADVVDLLRLRYARLHEGELVAGAGEPRRALRPRRASA